MDSLGLQFIFPEITLVFFALAILMAGVFERCKNYLGILALIGVIASAMSMPASLSTGASFFSGMLVNDGWSMIFRQVLLLIAGLLVLLSMGYKGLTDEDKAEYYFFLLVVTLAMMLAVASSNLMMIYIALETISILSYIMAGFLKRDVFSSEAGVKYFLFGSLSTGVTLYGISLVYGLFGTLDLSSITTILATTGTNQTALWVALILVLVGFAFKCSLVPFHMWTPDVYQGAPTPVAALFSVAPKAVGFAFLLRVYIEHFHAAFWYWTPLAVILAIVTMTIGNIAALKQENIKRLLAYSTIAQAGYILVGLAIATPAGIQASIYYIVIYSLMNLGAFGAVIVVSNTLKSERISDYAGMYKHDPLTAIVLSVSLLSLAGIPPLAGFLAKFFLLAGAVEAGHIILALIVVINSIIALYYYARVIKAMFLDDVRPMAPLEPRSIAAQSALIFTLACNLTLCLYPHPVITWISQCLKFV